MARLEIDRTIRHEIFIRAKTMRKTIFPNIFALCAGQSFSQHAPNPFTTAPGERWQGRIVYKDGDKNYSDLYEIIFVANGTCIITVSATESGVALFQDGDGLWSYDDNFLRIECDFYSPQIGRLPGIRWVSVYPFDNLKNRFTLLVPPYPGAENNVRIPFIKTGD
jgi:hypothetical protein